MSSLGDGEGAAFIAEALVAQGVDKVFGVVGIPVIEVGIAFQSAGLSYYGCRNEQAASYAAGAVGYLTQRPGVCLVVSGPGVIHALAGLANARENCWPILLLGGANDTLQDGMMAFQEERQIEAVRPYCKFAARPPTIDQFPFFLDRAIRIAVSGRPGPVYLDLPGDMVNSAPRSAGGGGGGSPPLELPRFFPTPASAADDREVARAVQLLRGAKRPLVVVGKGMAYARAEAEVRRLVRDFALPFLPTPMGKGVVSDYDPNLVIAARSKALQEADVVVLLGARLNWILHFGLPPRFAADAKFVKLDVSAQEMGNNRRAAAALCGDGRLVVAQLDRALRASGYSRDAPWFVALRAKAADSARGLAALMADERAPMSYYRAFRDVHGLAPRDAVIVTEGANTMDIGRGILANDLPRHRLDAGSYGTMGVGLGQALAAQAVHPDKKVICIEGDSAIGFSLAELETLCRYRLPVTVVVINNSGIGVGLPISGDTHEERLEESPVTSLTQHARYDQVMEAFGGKGFFVERPDQLAAALKEAYESLEPTLVNVLIDPFATRKRQSFDWLTRQDNQGDAAAATSKL